MWQSLRVSVVFYTVAGIACVMFPSAAPVILVLAVGAVFLQVVPRLARVIKLARTAEHHRHQEHSLAAQLAAANARLTEQGAQHGRDMAALTAAQEDNGKVACASWELGERFTKLSERYRASQRLVDEVSHDFRTPLSVIKGYSEILREGMAGPLTEEQLKFSQLIIDRTRDLAQMVDDLLDTTKLRAGTLHVDRVACDVAEICKGLRTVIDTRAAANGIRWEEDIEPGLPRVFVDPEKAGRALVNLALHAIKISPEGGRVALSVRRDGENEVRVSVKDAGPGIAEDNLAVMREQMSGRDGTNAQTGGKHGKGLGVALSVASEFARLNLGRLEVESALRKGSEFSLTLPVNEPAAIMASLFDMLSREETAAGSIAVMRVTSRDGGRTPPQLRAFLASTGFPGDVILANADKTALILAGYSEKPANWHKRLLTLAAGLEEMSPRQKLCPFDAEIVGTAAYPGCETEATALVIGEVEAKELAAIEVLPVKRMEAVLAGAVG